jgi:hypothetical protein
MHAIHGGRLTADFVLVVYDLFGRGDPQSTGSGHVRPDGRVDVSSASTEVQSAYTSVTRKFSSRDPLDDFVLNDFVYNQVFQGGPKVDPELLGSHFDLYTRPEISTRGHSSGSNRGLTILTKC